MGCAQLGNTSGLTLGRCGRGVAAGRDPDNTLRSCITFTCSLSCFLLPGSWAGQLGFWEVKGQGHQIREGAWARRQTLGVPRGYVWFSLVCCRSPP